MRDYSIAKKIYCQVTLNCNQRCAMCCYGCSPEHKEFMSMDVFKASLKLEPKALFNFGGGEPTCHKLFWDFMDVAIKVRGAGNIWIATNGKKHNDAILIAGMIRDKVIRGCLSQDQWHEKVGQDVIDAFRQARATSLSSTIRDVGRGGTLQPIRQGRCDWGNRHDCNSCGEVFVQWDGKVRQCACNDAPIIGDVFSGYKPMFSGSKAWACAFNLPDPNLR